MRDKLIKILQDMSRVAFTNEKKTEYLLEHDVVPVVKCKDCKYSKDGDCCRIFETETGRGNFCGYGERRTEDAEI